QSEMDFQAINSCCKKFNCPQVFFKNSIPSNDIGISLISTKSEFDKGTVILPATKTTMDINTSGLEKIILTFIAAFDVIHGEYNNDCMRIISLFTTGELKNISNDYCEWTSTLKLHNNE
ncbi:unnamed protein product, partial [Didymodactylos carnosus]